MASVAVLSDVATIERNSIDASVIPVGTRYVGLEHIESGGQSLSFAYLETGQVSSAKFLFDGDQVLFGKLRPYLAKIVSPYFDGVCSTDILPIRPGPKLDRGYLTHFLRHPKTVEWASSRATGINLPRLSPKQLESLQIPLPPLDEQRRIAAILDKASALRLKRKRALALLDGLAQSIFLQMFGDPVSNEKAVASTTLGELGVAMTYGPRFHNEKYSNDGIRIVRITDLDSNGDLDFESMPRLAVSEEDLNTHRSHPGEILFARTGATVGKMALVAAEDPVTIPGAYFIRLRFPKEVDPAFAWQAMRCASIQKIIEEQSRQSAQQNFSGPGLRRLPFLLPDKVEQERFAAVRRKLMVSKQMDRKHDLHIAQLFTSLQHRAFSGRI